METNVFMFGYVEPNPLLFKYIKLFASKIHENLLYTSTERAWLFEDIAGKVFYKKELPLQ